MAKKLTQTEEYLNEILSSDSPTAFLNHPFEQERNLGAFLTRKLDEQGLKKGDIVRKSQINETYVYELFSGKKKKPNRNYVLALCIAMGLSTRDTKRALYHANVGDLYARNRRDAIIINCVSKKRTLMQTNEALYKAGEETITGEGDKRG